MPRPHVEVVLLSPSRTPSIVVHDGIGRRIFEVLNLRDQGGFFNRQWTLEGTDLAISSYQLRDEMDGNLELLQSMGCGAEIAIPVKALRNKRLRLRRVK